MSVRSLCGMRLWALPSVLLALFGGACAFMSRLQADIESSVAWMTFVGLALQLMVGFLLCKWAFPVIPAAHSRSIHLIALGAVILLSAMRLAFGSQISFVCVQLLLFIGMAYQTGSMVLLYNAARRKGWNKIVSAIIGGFLCSASVVLVEVGTRCLFSVSITESEAFVWIVACALVSAVAIFLFMILSNCEIMKNASWTEPSRDIDQQVTPFSADAKNTMTSNLRNDCLCDVSFEQAQALWKAALSERLLWADEVYGLTRREEEVLGHLAHGDPLQIIADRMYVSRGTIKSHVSRIYRKMGVSSRYEAVDLLMGDIGQR